jgi:hypothetical protein
MCARTDIAVEYRKFKLHLTTAERKTYRYRYVDSPTALSTSEIRERTEACEGQEPTLKRDLLNQKQRESSPAEFGTTAPVRI